MSVEQSVIQGQNVTVDQLILPLGFNLDGAPPSLQTVEGGLAYNIDGTTGVYYSDGVDWFRLDSSAPDQTTLASTGGESLVVNGTGPNLTIKGLEASTRIAVTDNTTTLGISCTIPYQQSVDSIALGNTSGIAGDNNTLIGSNAAVSMSGDDNTIIGAYAGNALTGAQSNNVIIGSNEGILATTSFNNVYINTQNATSTDLGQLNVCIGINSGQNMDGGSHNVFVGHDAGKALETGTNNIAMGLSAMDGCGISVQDAVAIGRKTLRAVSGQYNIGIGLQAGELCTTGAQNVYIGRVAGSSNLTGNTNVVIGDGSVNGNAGSNNIIVGAQNGASFGATTVSNNIIIANGWAGSASLADTIKIGTSQTRCFVQGIRGITTSVADAIPVLIDSANQLGTASSSELVKENIYDINDWINTEDVIRKLRPVTFNYVKKRDPTQTKTMGLIAQEVKKVLPNIVVGEGEDMTVQYQHLPILLLAEVKRLQKEIEKISNIQIKQLMNSGW